MTHACPIANSIAHNRAKLSYSATAISHITTLRLLCQVTSPTPQPMACNLPVRPQAPSQANYTSSHSLTMPTTETIPVEAVAMPASRVPLNLNLMLLTLAALTPLQ
jgi:hypothetical protein